MTFSDAGNRPENLSDSLSCEHTHGGGSPPGVTVPPGDVGWCLEAFWLSGLEQVLLLCSLSCISQPHNEELSSKNTSSVEAGKPGLRCHKSTKRNQLQVLLKGAERGC